MMSKNMNTRDGADEGVPSLNGPRDEGETGFPPATAHLGEPVIDQAGTEVKATDQVDIETFMDTIEKELLSDSEVDISNSNRDVLQAASANTVIGNNSQGASARTELGIFNILNVGKTKVDNDNFESPEKVNNSEVEIIETSINPADITVVSPSLNESDSNIIKDQQLKKKKPSGAEIKKAKRMKKGEDEGEGNEGEVVELDPKQMFVNRNYNIANRTYSQAAKAAGGRMLEVRSKNTEYLLVQSDFDHIDSMCIKKFVEIWRTGDTTEFSMKGGLSQGGV